MEIKRRMVFVWIKLMNCRNNTGARYYLPTADPFVADD